MRVLLDTNVVISAVLFGGRPADLLDLLSEAPFELWTSRPLVDELVDVLAERKLKDALANSGLTAEDVVRAYTRETLVVPDEELGETEFPADPDDAKVIAAALAGEVHWVVSGDAHLLRARGLLRCEVLTVTEALRRATDVLRRSQP